MKRTEYVIASEIAQYVYCQCCYYDTLEGVKHITPEMEKGKQEHEAAARQLFFLDNIQTFALFLIGSSVVFLIIAFVLWYLFKPV